MVKPAHSWLCSLLRPAKKQQRSAPRAAKALRAATAVKPAAKARARKAPVADAVAGGVPSSSRPPAGMRPRAKPEAANARAAPGGRWLVSLHTGSWRQGALHSMFYWLYLPLQAPPEGLPLVVMLHGCDQSANTLAQGTRMNQLAGKRGFAVVYPQQSVVAHPQACWKWYDRATQLGGGDVEAIVGIVNEVAATHPIDRSRIYICGFSAGGAMAHIVALNHPGLIAGLGVHSAPIYGAARGAVSAMKVMLHGDAGRVESAIEEVLARQPGFPPMPTILIHGEGDTVVRSINQAQLEQQALLLNRVPVGTPVEIVLNDRTAASYAYQLRDLRVERKLLLRVVRVAELKHAWSGGDDSLVFNSGPGPDSSMMLVDFFALHRRQRAPAAIL